MIAPWLYGFLRLNQAPLTWTLLALNIVFFMATSKIDEVISLEKNHLLWAGRYYAEMKNEKIEDRTQLLLKGSQALRNDDFLKALPQFQPHGDAVGFAESKKRIQEFYQQLDRRPVSTFGLQGRIDRPLTWVTYQFMHSGAGHLIANMAMLLIFGAALELLMGSFALVVVYLLGGISGALLFLYLQPSAFAPMVGASASLSAVMSFYALVEKKRRVRFFYFLLPSPGYWGYIYLPTLLILPLFFVSDLASYFSTHEDIGAGIAYAAHLGGALFGITLALFVRSLCRSFPQLGRSLYASYSPSHSEAP